MVIDLTNEHVFVFDQLEAIEDITRAHSSASAQLASLLAYRTMDELRRANGGPKLILFRLVLLASYLSTVLTSQENCYNGPAPVIVNEDADVFLGE